MHETPQQVEPVNSQAGFTLVEILVSSMILVVTVAGALGLFMTYRHSLVSTSLVKDTSSEVSAALERIIYGNAANGGLRAVEAQSVVLSEQAGGWRLDFGTNRFLAFNPVTGEIQNEKRETVCRDIEACTAALTNNGCALRISVSAESGGHAVTNTMASFVTFRN